LLETVGPDVRHFSNHEHDGIAIQAAWEEVTRTRQATEPDRKWRPDKHKLSWFVGYLEGRTRISAPDWWVQTLLDTQALGLEGASRHCYDKSRR
jgi:hypothetical protein